MRVGRRGRAARAPGVGSAAPTRLVCPFAGVVRRLGVRMCGVAMRRGGGWGEVAVVRASGNSITGLSLCRE